MFLPKKSYTCCSRFKHLLVAGYYVLRMIPVLLQPLLKGLEQEQLWRTAVEWTVFKLLARYTEYNPRFFLKSPLFSTFIFNCYLGDATALLRKYCRFLSTSSLARSVVLTRYSWAASKQSCFAGHGLKMCRWVMQLNSPAPLGHAVATTAKRGASKSLWMVFIFSGSGMLIFILLGLVAAQTSGMDSVRS